MRFVIVESFGNDGKITGCRGIYAGSTMATALWDFRKDYPEHSHCILVAEEYEAEKVDWVICGIDEEEETDE